MIINAVLVGMAIAARVALAFLEPSSELEGLFQTATCYIIMAVCLVGAVVHAGVHYYAEKHREELEDDLIVRLNNIKDHVLAIYGFTRKDGR